MVGNIYKHKCTWCEKHKADKGRYADKQNKLKQVPAKRPWQVIKLDIEEVKPEGGKTLYYIVVVCFFTRYVEAIHIANKSTSEVVNALKSSRF